MFFSKRQKRRQRQREEIVASLERTRDAANAGALELRLCRAVLDYQGEQLEAAVAVNDEGAAREIMTEMRPLLAERERLEAREAARDEILRNGIEELQKCRKSTDQ